MSDEKCKHCTNCQCGKKPAEEEGDVSFDTEAYMKKIEAKRRVQFWRKQGRERGYSR